MARLALPPGFWPAHSGTVPGTTALFAGEGLSLKMRHTNRLVDARRRYMTKLQSQQNEQVISSDGLAEPLHEDLVLEYQDQPR